MCDRCDEIGMGLLAGEPPNGQNHGLPRFDPQLITQRPDILWIRRVPNGDRAPQYADPLAPDPESGKLIRKWEAIREDACRLSQRPAVQLVIRQHLQVLRGIAMMKGDPGNPCAQPGDTREKMHSDSVCLDNSRSSMLYQLFQLPDRARVVTIPFNQYIYLDSRRASRVDERTCDPVGSAADCGDGDLDGGVPPFESVRRAAELDQVLGRSCHRGRVQQRYNPQRRHIRFSPQPYRIQTSVCR